MDFSGFQLFLQHIIHYRLGDLNNHNFAKNIITHIKVTKTNHRNVIVHERTPQVIPPSQRV